VRRTPRCKKYGNPRSTLTPRAEATFTQTYSRVYPKRRLCREIIKKEVHAIYPIFLQYIRIMIVGDIINFPNVEQLTESFK
jgi:hypothetical protein